jgi:signal transduction histidine kinase
MRSGKFRKDNFNFDVREAIEEIMSIQMLKAEFCGIDLSFEMVNFPMKSKFDQIVSNVDIDSDLLDYIVCSDMQRLQQVILNLLSNALKFTQSGGFVKITCTYVKNSADLIHREHHKYFLNSKGHGMI